DVLANGPLLPRDLPRRRRLVLLEHAAGFRERQLLHEITAQPEPIPAAEPRNRAAERVLHERKVTRALRIRRSAPTRLETPRFVQTATRTFLVRQRLQPALGPQTVDVPL